MSYYDLSLAGDTRVRFDALVGDWPDVERKTMFGCPAYRASDDVFAVLVTEGLVLTRLDDPTRARLEATYETALFHTDGRLVSGWVVVPRSAANIEELEPFVRTSYESAMTA